MCYFLGLVSPSWSLKTSQTLSVAKKKRLIVFLAKILLCAHSPPRARPDKSHAASPLRHAVFFSFPLSFFFFFLYSFFSFFSFLFFSLRHYYKFIFTAGPKPIFTASLGGGGDILAVKMPPVLVPAVIIHFHHRSIARASGENSFHRRPQTLLSPTTLGAGGEDSSARALY